VSFVETADEVTNLTQRLSIYLPVNIKVNKVMEQLGDIAKENRTQLADSGKLFTQLLPPINRIKGGVAETIAIVDAFGKAMLIGGVNTQEAASATIQFGQAMASGKLAGDEFRSLAEASPRLLQAIADGAGIAAQKLKEMSFHLNRQFPIVHGELVLPKNIYKVVAIIDINHEPIYYINKKFKYKDYNEYSQLVDYYEYGNSIKELNDKIHVQNKRL
jgi:tape measure domain-containing protein